MDMTGSLPWLLMMAWGQYRAGSVSPVRRYDGGGKSRGGEDHMTGTETPATSPTPPDESRETRVALITAANEADRDFTERHYDEIVPHS
jgi:hypothetical protein